jgi:hypothetical protein
MAHHSQGNCDRYKDITLRMIQKCHDHCIVKISMENASTLQGLMVTTSVTKGGTQDTEISQENL